MNELIPAILAHDEATFRERLALMGGVAQTIQLDVMDGAFVPNTTWFDAEVLRELSTTIRFELHLMVRDPMRYIEETRDIESVTRALWHVETTVDHAALISRCHAIDKEAGLAINPHTPIEALAQYAANLDEILVMGADPGFSGQRLQTPTVDKAREIHARWPSIPIGFDISVNAETIPQLLGAGVSRFCAAGAIWKAEDPVAEAKKLHAMVAETVDKSS